MKLMMMPLAKKTATSHNHTTANFFTLIDKITIQTAVNNNTSFDSSPDKKVTNEKKNNISNCHYLLIQKTGVKKGFAFIKSLYCSLFT